jgi:uncharacterized protein YqgV (UPF0045/DUF77 family)
MKGGDKMKSALSIQCLPLIENKEEMYRLVDRAINVIKKSGLAYTVGSFETTIEGDLDEIWPVAYQAHKAIIETGISQVITYIKLASGKNLGSTEEKLRKYTVNNGEKNA